MPVKTTKQIVKILINVQINFNLKFTQFLVLINLNLILMATLRFHKKV